MPTTRRPDPVEERAAREARRLRAAQLFAQGRSQAEVAHELGVSRQSAHVWHTRFEQGGVGALRSRGPTGPDPKLSDAQLAKVEQALRELCEAGIKVKVIPITAHPLIVGTIEFPSHQLDPRGVERAKGEFWIDPAQFTGTVEVLIYVAPKPGEAWQQAPSVFHPDQPLGGLPCARPGPMGTATLEHFARQVGITQFRWLVTAGDPTAHEVRLEERSGRPDVEVESAMLRSPTLLEVTVRPAELVARHGHAHQPSMNINLHEAQEPRCTPQLAARWR